MLYRVKITRDIDGKQVSEYYITDAQNFGYAGINVINLLGSKIEIDDVLLLKNYKPPINEYTEGDKVYIVKIAEESIDNKTLKYPMPVFAKNDTDLYIKVKNFIKAGMCNMRLTTISETKWKWI